MLGVEYHTQSKVGKIKVFPPGKFCLDIMHPNNFSTFLLAPSSHGWLSETLPFL